MLGTTGWMQQRAGAELLSALTALARALSSIPGLKCSSSFAISFKRGSTRVGKLLYAQSAATMKILVDGKCHALGDTFFKPVDLFS